MRRVAQALVRLYPTQWRERYGEEFEALIEDSSPGWRATFDLVKGALKMQLNMPSFPKLAVILSLAGLAAGLALSMIVPSRYVSTAVLQLHVDPGPSTSRNLTEHLVRMEQEVLSRTSVAAIIKDPRLDLYKNDRVHVPLEDVIERMRTRDIRINIQSASGNYAVFRIAFEYRDRMKAQETVQALASRFMDSNMEMRAQTDRTREQPYREAERLEARLTAVEKKLGITPPPEHLEDTVFGPEGINLEVLETPSLAATPVYPNRPVFMATGVGAGFALAIVIAAFRKRPPAIPFPAQTA